MGKIRSVFLLLLMIGVAFLGGCATSGGVATTQPGSVDWNTVISSNSSTITTGVEIGVTFTLATVKDSTQRAAIGKTAYNVASAVYAAAGDPNVALTDLQSLALTQIANSNSAYKPELTILFQLASDAVEGKASTLLADADSGTKATATRELIRAAALGVVKSTTQYSTTK